MTSSNDDTKASGVAYGSLYMDAGEDMDLVENQVYNVSEGYKDLKMWFFDIVCTPNQIPTANINAGKVTAIIHECCPHLKGFQIVVGVTTKDGDRPARSIMMKIASGEKTDTILEELDLNSDRRFLWVNGNMQK